MTSIGRCAACSLNIVAGDYCEMNGLNYHQSCFKCQRCHTALVGKPFVPIDLPYIYCPTCRPNYNVAITYKDFRKGQSNLTNSGKSNDTNNTTDDVTKSQGSANKNCTSCNVELRSGARFCRECGLQQFITADHNNQAAITPDSSFKFCSECGSRHKMPAPFCTKCGFKI
jgi:ribosomal protein L40E